MLDTNVLLYSLSKLPPEAPKAAVARALVDRRDFGLSAQVLAEFYTILTTKAAFVTDARVAQRIVRRLAELPCVPVDAALVEAGVELSIRYAISYWDGAIVAAAHRLGASVLLTEDLSHGQTYGSVRVENPFLNA
jgi:predicted nucleic acid-binding protein